MDRHLVVLSAALLLYHGGCASPSAGGSGRSNAPPPEAVHSGQAVFLRLQVDRVASSHRIAATVEQAWFALAAVYGELGIPTEVVEARSRMLGNRRHTVRGQLQRIPLTRFLDCGTGLSGPIAAQNRILLDILSQLRPAAEGGVEVQTTIAATAIPVEGTSNNPMPCSSTGALEELIVERIEMQLGAGGR